MATTDHDEPFQRSASAVPALPELFVDEPAAQQSVPVTQVTLLR